MACVTCGTTHGPDDCPSIVPASPSSLVDDSSQALSALPPATWQPTTGAAPAPTPDQEAQAMATKVRDVVDTILTLATNAGLADAASTAIANEVKAVGDPSEVAAFKTLLTDTAAKL